MQAGLEESVNQTFELFQRAISEHGTTENYNRMVRNPNVIRDLLVLATQPRTAAYRPVIYALVLRLHKMDGAEGFWTGVGDELFLRDVLQQIIETEDVPDRALTVTEILAMFLCTPELRIYFVQYLFEQIAKRDAKMPMFVQYQARVISVSMHSEEYDEAFQWLVESVKTNLAEPSDLNVAVQTAMFWSCRPWAIGWHFRTHPSMDVLADAAMASVRWFSGLRIESLTEDRRKVALNLASAAELLLRECFIGGLESETCLFPEKFNQHLSWCIGMLPQWIAVWQPNGFPTQTITCVSKAVQNGFRCESEEQLGNLLLTCVLYGANAQEEDFGDSFHIFWAESYEGSECTRTDVSEIILKLLAENPVCVFRFLVGIMSSSIPDERKEVVLYFLSHTVAFLVNTRDEALIGQMARIACEQLSEANMRENNMIRPTRLILASKAVALLPADFSRVLVGVCVSQFIAPVCHAFMIQQNVAPSELILASAATAYLYEWFNHTREPVPLDIVRLMLGFAQVSLSPYASGIVKLGCTEAMSQEIISNFYWPAIEKLVASARSSCAQELQIFSETLKRYVSCCCDVIEISKGQISDDLIETCLSTLSEADEIECAIMLMHALAFAIPDRARMLNILHGFIREFSVSSIWGRDIALLATEMILRLDLPPEEIVVLIDFLDMFIQDDIEVIDLIPGATAACRMVQMYANLGPLTDPRALAQLLAKIQNLVEKLQQEDKQVEFVPLYALSILEIQLTELICGLPFDMDTLQGTLKICCEHKTFVEDYYVWLLTCALSRGKEQLKHLDPETIVAAVQNRTLADESFHKYNAEYLCCACFPVPDRLCT